jgi:hypothetical protein
MATTNGTDATTAGTRIYVVMGWPYGKAGRDGWAWREETTDLAQVAALITKAMDAGLGVHIVEKEDLSGGA